MAAYCRVYDSHHLQADCQNRDQLRNPIRSVIECGLSLPFLRCMLLVTPLFLHADRQTRWEVGAYYTSTYPAQSVREELVDAAPVVEVEMKHADDTDKQQRAPDRRCSYRRQTDLVTCQPGGRRHAPSEDRQQGSQAAHRVHATVHQPSIQPSIQPTIQPTNQLELSCH